MYKITFKPIYVDASCAKEAVEIAKKSSVRIDVVDDIGEPLIKANFDFTKEAKK